MSVEDKSTIVRTIGDATRLVQDLVDHQLTKAREANPPPNAPIRGDAEARTAFYALLPRDQQRSIFLQTASHMSSWPRLRALYGAPPYSFLHSGDASLLRAAGISKGRTNMSFEELRSASGYSQFVPQLVDEFDREYKVVPQNHTSEDSPLLVDLALASAEVMLEVRIKKRSRASKINMLKTSQRKALTFPFPGDVLKLVETKVVRNLRGFVGVSKDTHVRVKRVAPRGENSATAALVAVRT